MGPYAVSGSVRATGERGKNEGVWEGTGFRALSLPRLFSLAAVFVRYHRLRAWNRLNIDALKIDIV